MAAAMQLSAVTSHITSNIAAIPLLWILPLAVYLITFILAFEFPRLYRRSIVVRLLVLMLASLGYAISKMDTSLPIGIAILFFLAECLRRLPLLHAEAYALRPRSSSETTLFYLLVAAGGVTGTFFIGIASPLIFAANYDLAITFFVTALLALAVTWPDGWGQRLLWTTGSVLLLVLNFALHAAYAQRGASADPQLLRQPPRQADSLPRRPDHAHAAQRHHPARHPDLQPRPHPHPDDLLRRDSGIGLALAHCCDNRPRNIGVVGLGAGTLAAYGNAGDRIRFYEINPHVQPIARNLFTYLRDSPAQHHHRRRRRPRLARPRSPAALRRPRRRCLLRRRHPLHLLTTEALTALPEASCPRRHPCLPRLQPVPQPRPRVAQLAATIHMQARLFDTHSVESRGEYRVHLGPATASPTFFTLPEISVIATPITPIPDLRAWTDDYSSLLPIFQPTNH